MEKGKGPNDAQGMQKKEARLAKMFDDGFPDWDVEEEHDHAH